MTGRPRKVNRPDRPWYSGEIGISGRNPAREGVFMRRRTTHLLLLISLFIGAGSSWAADNWTAPFTGGRLLHRTTTNPAWNIHVLEVKLDVPGVSLRSTTSAERKQTPSSFAKLVGAKAAINGDFFLYTDYSTRGLAAGDGTRWPGSVDTAQYGAVVFGPGNEVAVYPPAVQVTFDPKTMLGAVGGRPAIAAAGAVIDNTGYGAHCTTRHPRTAVGLSKDGRTLFMAVVDGRQTASVGMTCNELGKLLVDVGAYTALSLDGGGSSAMYVAGLGVVSLPSDGKERVVANHLAVLAPPAESKGTLKGIIYEGTDTQQVIAGASVTLEGVATDTSDARGLYEFYVPPGTYTVTAGRPGYVTRSIQRTVVAGQTYWGSIGLERAPVTADTDEDGVPDTSDNCSQTANEGQADLDADGAGDVCDVDDDGDAVPDEDDNCPGVKNADQQDSDGDSRGAACDDESAAPPAAQPEQASPDEDGTPAEPHGCSSAGRAMAPWLLLVCVVLASGRSARLRRVFAL